MLKLYFYLLCTMDLLEEKGVLHGNVLLVLLLIICNVSQDNKFFQNY